MKKLFLKTTGLILFTLLLNNNSIAQDYAEDNEEPQRVVNENATLRTSAWSKDNNNTALAANSQSNSSSSAQRQGILDAPPDCPECIPDPAGDVPDVPFDRRLLVILIPAVIFIVLKAYKNQVAKKALDADATCLNHLQTT